MSFAARFSVVAAVLLVGCAADTTEIPAAEPETGEDAEIKAMKFFDCHGGSNDGNMNHLELGVGGGKARVTDLSKDAAVQDTGNSDPSYKPNSAEYKDSTRYLGFDKTVKSIGGDVADLQLMTSKEIEAGQSGKAWIRMAGPEGGGTTRYTCTKKTKALAVDTKIASRLVCSLDKLACHKGAPPGDTCLADVLVMQSGGSASLRVTWLDHFGVNVKERKESLGNAPLSRTKTTAKGTWGTDALSLKYRAGITYTGTFEDAGNKSPITCNDLAMLDQ
jgi:hypothetical protein